MSWYIARVAIRLSWGTRLYSLPSPEGGSQVYLMCGSGACPLFAGKWISWTRVLMLVCPRDNRRELVPQGQTGGLTIFEDHPNYWDAWGAFTVHIPHSEALLLTRSYGSSDVEIHHLEKAQQLKFANVKAVASGPLLAAVETEIKYGKSTIKVTVSVRRSGARGLSADVIH